MKLGQTLYARDRREWRRWLAKNHARAREVWLVYPTKKSGKPRIPYNDGVEEALSFGWIDSTNKRLDEHHIAQRFTPRRPGSRLSAMNLERARRLIAAHRMTKAGLRVIGDQLKLTRLHVAPDILAALRAEPGALANFRRFPASYKRIRIGFIEGARDRPAECKKRLRYFVKMTAQNKRYGMVQ